MIVKRKVRNGRVKINNAWYYPQETHMKYDGRCDGYEFYFGLYGGETGFVSLHSIVPGRDSGTNELHVINGALPWSFWYKK